MKKHWEYQVNVIELAPCRDLLADWEEVRKQILLGKMKGFALCLMGDQGCEKVVLGGRYKTDKAGALRSAMRMSMELNKAFDEPLELAVGQG